MAPVTAQRAPRKRKARATYSSATVVWAKTRGHPWWPGICFKAWDEVNEWLEEFELAPPKGNEQVVTFAVSALNNLCADPTAVAFFTPEERAKLIGELPKIVSAARAPQAEAHGAHRRLCGSVAVLQPHPRLYRLGCCR